MSTEPDPAAWAVVASRFNEAVVDRLLAGALDCLANHGVDRERITVLRVAGAFEVAQAVGRLLSQPREWRGVVALAALVRGETPHFDHLAAETTRSLLDSAVRSGVAVGYGVLTCDTMDQALARAGGDRGNKGWETAEAAIDLAASFARIDAP